MYYHTLFCNYVLISFLFRKEHIDFYINSPIRSSLFFSFYTETVISPFMSRIIDYFTRPSSRLTHTHTRLPLINNPKLTIIFKHTHTALFRDFVQLAWVLLSYLCLKHPTRFCKRINQLLRIPLVTFACKCELLDLLSFRGHDSLTRKWNIMK